MVGARARSAVMDQRTGINTSRMKLGEGAEIAWARVQNVEMAQRTGINNTDDEVRREESEMAGACVENIQKDILLLR